MISAAAEALPGTRITAVTILTSLSDEDLDLLGIAGPSRDAVVRLATLAVDAGARFSDKEEAKAQGAQGCGCA